MKGQDGRPGRTNVLGRPGDAVSVWCLSNKKKTFPFLLATKEIKKLVRFSHQIFVLPPVTFGHGEKVRKSGGKNGPIFSFLLVVMRNGKVFFYLKDRF